MKNINFTDFRNDLQDKVLLALTEYMRETLDTSSVNGWSNDSEIMGILLKVDRHAEVLAHRINEGHMTNSANVNIVFDLPENDLL